MDNKNNDISRSDYYKMLENTKEQIKNNMKQKTTVEFQEDDAFRTGRFIDRNLDEMEIACANGIRKRIIRQTRDEQLRGQKKITRIIKATREQLIIEHKKLQKSEEEIIIHIRNQDKKEQNR